MSRLSLTFGLLIILITSLPQIYFLCKLGSEWHGAFAYFDTDELAYAAYVNALKDGRPRRNDPYTGNDGGPGETLYSIQFATPYLIALPARALRISTPTAFIIVTPLVTLAAYLLIYFLLLSLTGQRWLSAIGAFATLCLGGFLASPPSEVFSFPRYAFPFLRRYEPAFPFPIFFALALCVWKALTKSVLWALTAGALLAVLIFSYFYLWTAAAAWLFALALLWFWKVDRSRAIKVFGIITAFGIATLIPYGILLTHRVAATDQADLMEYTHRPDLLRGPEIYALILMFWLARRALTKENLFAWSFIGATFIVFNQQILTGRSLQPFHYEEFISNYWIVIAALIPLAQIKTPQRVLTIAAAVIAIIGFWLAGSFAVGRLPYNIEVDRAREAILKLNGAGIVFSPNRYMSTSIPVDKPNPVLWSRYVYTFSPLNFSAHTERLYKFLYYSGVSPEQFKSMIADKDRLAEVFGYRAHPHLTRNVAPITQQEIDQVVRNYERLCKEFGPTEAHDPELSYAILSETDSTTNLDRWYERSESQKIGDFVIYKLRPR